MKKAEKALNAFQEQVNIPKKCLEEQSNKLLTKDRKVAIERELVLKLNQQMTSLLEIFTQAQAQNETDKCFFESATTAPAL